MSCPHSSAPGTTPQNCSQCLMAVPKQISYDPETRQLLVDGKEHKRELPSSDNPPPNRGTVASGGRRPKTCGQCGQVGHTRVTCGKRAA